MKKEKVECNGSSLRLLDSNANVELKFSGEGDEKKPVLDMLAYSGGIIPGHWYWGNLAIDLEGLKIPAKKIPILEDHATSLKIAFATKWSKENNELRVVDATFVDTPESLKFRELSGQGFPYEASIYARPEKVQRIAEDETAMVNGFEMKGPGSIWRKSILKESSICTFGYDPNTKSASMSDEGSETVVYETESKNNPDKEEKTVMKKEQFKAEHPEEYKSLVDEISAVAATKFADEKGALEQKLADITAENTKLSSENVASEKRLVALERNEAIRAEKEIKLSADAAFNSKFAESRLPERLSPKIRRLVDHEQFVAEGVLDTEKFNAAIDAELAEWTTGESEGEIQGFSSGGRGFDTSGDSDKDSDSAVDRMLGHIGQSK